MLIEKRPNRHAPGGVSRHFWWPLMLNLIWTTDWEFRWGPMIFEVEVWTVLIALAALIAWVMT